MNAAELSPSEVVALMPRRTAHAVHALLATQADIGGGPVRVTEVVLRDREAISVSATAAALASAKKRGLVATIQGVWIPTALALALEETLEDRFLADTAPTDRRGDG